MGNECALAYDIAYSTDPMPAAPLHTPTSPKARTPPRLRHRPLTLCPARPHTRHLVARKSVALYRDSEE